MQGNLQIGTEWVAVNGGIAQLGERLHGMQEVIGSIPFTSTKVCLEEFSWEWLGCKKPG